MMNQESSVKQDPSYFTFRTFLVMNYFLTKTRALLQIQGHMDRCTHCYGALPEMEGQCVLYLNNLTQLYCYISWWYPCYIVGYCVLPILYQLVTSCFDRNKQSSQRMIPNKACETPIGKSGGWSVLDKERSPSAVVGLWEVQTLITLEVVKQMSVLRSRQSWPTKPSGPFIVQNVHPYLRKTQNQLQINLGTVFTHSHFVPPIS